MIICTAETGHRITVATSLYDIARSQESIKPFLAEQTGVDPASMICFLPDGQQLRDENLLKLSGVPDETIYVFNREYLFLDTELSEVIRDLELPRSIKPPLPDTATPETILKSATDHMDHVTSIITSLQVNYEALRVASSNLDSHVLSLSEVFENFEALGHKELDRQSELLRNHNLDLEIISKIRVHPEFLSPSVRRDVEAGVKERMLGDYVSNAKMKMVADSCAKTHDDLKTRLANAKTSMNSLVTGADEVRACITTSFMEDAEPYYRRAAHHLSRLREIHAGIKNNSPSSSTIMRDILNFEKSIRNEVENVNDIQNQSTAHILTVLRQVSFLQSTLAELPATLTTLETDLRGKGGFVHLQRLHHMLYMYGATLVEIVRRKEFSKFFADRAQSLAEVMARLSSNERKRRQVYRGEVHGQLPFETKGMDEPTPVLEVSTTGQSENVFALTREDIAIFLDTIDLIERSTAVPTQPLLTQGTDDNQYTGSGGRALSHPVRETRAALEKLISRMEGLGAEFDKLIERSVLSADRMGHSKRRSASDASAYRDAVDQLRELQEAKVAQDQAFTEERENSAAELRQLRLRFSEVTRENDEQMSRLDSELTSLRVVAEHEATARSSLEVRNAELRETVDDQGRKLANALSEATQKTKEVEILSRELEQARAEAEEMRQLQESGDERLTNLLAEQAETLRNLEEARLRGEDLEEQIKFARAEGDEAFRALNEATREKDRLLRTQSMEADRLLRDHIAEADGDRAVLEHQFSELHETHEATERELKDALMELDIIRADIAGLREELQRAQHEVLESQKVEKLLKAELARVQDRVDEQTRRLTSTDQLLADMLEVAVSFRDTNARLMSSTLKTLSHASKPSSRHVSLGDSTAALSKPPDEADAVKVSDAFTTYTTPIDWSDPAASIEILKRFDLEAFSETIQRSGTTIRKWQKQCKDYRERARGKISFRNFGKGDLALFLPTRNSVAKPWAAFNVSFPHYFLKATDQIAAQLKDREWIVARITSITERIVDPRDPDSNPYALGNGVKFYMLEVEDYAQPNVSRRTVSSPPPNVPSDTLTHKRERTISWSAPPTSPLTTTSPTSDVIDTIAISSSPHPRTFPRSGSSPAGPSSLSKLLAQASTDSVVVEGESKSETRVSSRPVSPIAPARSRSRTNSGHSHNLIRPSAIPPSPLRPSPAHSRTASHRSFPTQSAPPPFASPAPSVKAAPTTALSEAESAAHMAESSVQPIASSPSAVGSPLRRGRGLDTPSPDGSASEGMSNVLLSRSRKRTLSSKALPTTSTTLSGSLILGGGAGNVFANLASSWGVNIGRKRKENIRVNTTNPALLEGGEEDGETSANSPVQSGTSEARDLLKKLGSSPSKQRT